VSMQVINESQIEKLLAFLRVASKGDFEVSPELVATCLERVYRWARGNNLSIEIVDTSGTRVAFFSAGGAIVGATLGYVVGSIPGAIVGAVGGALVGYMVAHATIRMHPLERPGGPVVFTLA
jgi:hypothetical protein